MLICGSAGGVAGPTKAGRRLQALVAGGGRARGRGRALLLGASSSYTIHSGSREKSGLRWLVGWIGRESRGRGDWRSGGGAMGSLGQGS